MSKLIVHSLLLSVLRQMGIKLAPPFSLLLIERLTPTASSAVSKTTKVARAVLRALAFPFHDLLTS